MLKRLLLIILFFILPLLTACHSTHENQKAESQIYNVTLKNNVMHLYYNGVIKPIREELITSPASGVVSKVNFHYGDFVKQGQLLLSIHSPEMENEFRETISNFLRAKQTYLNSKKSMQGTEDLYKEKIISEQEYFNEQSQYQNNLLSYIEASNKIKQLFSYIPTPQEKIINMSLSDLDDVKMLLEKQFQDLTIYSKNPGIILFPEQNNSDAPKQIQVGYEVKKNDVLLVIGDLSGVSITAYVSETDVNHLTPGREVTITFSAQPELELHGKIVSVAKQAKNTENAGFSTFPIVIQAPKLSSYQIQKIRVGMSAKIDILVTEPPSLKIPIKAVFQKNDKNWVTLLDPASKKPREIPVETGATTLDEVAIIKGLKSGDKVVIHD